MERVLEILPPLPPSRRGSRMDEIAGIGLQGSDDQAEGQSGKRLVLGVGAAE